MTEAVFDAGGTIIDYAGDAVLAVWGVPIAQADHADRALHCALRVLQTLDDTEFLALQPDPQLCGIGIATGDVLVGPVGSSVMFKYGVFGPSVSAAQRLASLTKPGELGRPILLTGDVAQALQHPHAQLELLGPVQLRGMESMVDVFSADPDAAGAA